MDTQKSTKNDEWEIYDGLLCRPISLKDKEDITNGIVTYGGRDYMAAYFYDYFAENAFPCPMYCGEVDGKLVTFLGCLVMDDGKSLQFIGRRTREGYQNFGYSNLLKQYTIKCVKRNFPSVERLYSVAQSAQYTKEYLEKRNWICLMEIFTISSMTEWMNVKLPAEDVFVRKLDNSEAADYIVKKCQSVHPRQLFLCQYKVFDLTLSNLKHLTDPKKPYSVRSFVSETNDEVTSASFCTIYKANVGVMFQVDFRGSNYGEFLSHLRANFVNSRSLSPEKISFRFHFPTTLKDIHDVAIDLENIFGLKNIVCEPLQKVILEPH